MTQTASDMLITCLFSLCASSINSAAASWGVNKKKTILHCLYLCLLAESYSKECSMCSPDPRTESDQIDSKTQKAVRESKNSFIPLPQPLMCLLLHLLHPQSSTSDSMVHGTLMTFHTRWEENRRYKVSSKHCNHFRSVTTGEKYSNTRKSSIQNQIKIRVYQYLRCYKKQNVHCDCQSCTVNHFFFQ